MSELSNTLSAHVNGELVKGLIHFFTSICIATSFLGVSLCLSDFMADGLKIKKEKKRPLVIGCINPCAAAFSHSVLSRRFHCKFKLRRRFMRHFTYLLARINGLERPLC